MKIEAARSSETFIFCRNTTRRYNPEALDVNIHCRDEDFKPFFVFNDVF
jgi:hypothetical protein